MYSGIQEEGSSGSAQESVAFAWGFEGHAGVNEGMNEGVGSINCKSNT